MSRLWLNPDLNVEADVRAFFDKFQLPAPKRPAWPSHDMVNFRLGHIREEVQELEVACDQRDMASAADALADIVYLCVGTCIALGVPFGAVWREVQDANMKKVSALPDGSDSKRGSGFDVVKPK